MQKFDTKQLNDVVNEAYEKIKGDDGGNNADYIPFLAKVPSKLFGISVCLPDGEIVEAGDTDYVFGIESVSKVPTAILAMQQYGADTILQKIGADATGLPFNSIMAILLENDHPSTPLVNAGAITACSMVKPVGNSDCKWKSITDFLEVARRSGNSKSKKVSKCANTAKFCSYVLPKPTPGSNMI